MGEVEEEEPEGETVVGPSGEATIHDSGITLSPFSLLLLIYAYTHTYIYIYIYIYIFFLLLIPLLSLPFFSGQMSPLIRR